jgi:dTDP-4-dehydrorhamnose reductase
MLHSPFALPLRRLPLLVTGITGVAGYNAFRYFQRRYPGMVIGTRPRQTWKLTGEGVVAVDGEDQASLAELFRTYRFPSVLNCLGNCALKSCELDPAMARLINVESAAALIENARLHGSRVVHLSSDLVFSGSRDGGYRETDPTDPVTVYGKTMVQSEEVMKTSAMGVATLRISLPMGPSFNRHAGAIDWIQSRFRHHRPATLYFDEVRSCTYTDDLNRVFEYFLASDEAGLYHLGGPRASTLYQIGQIVNRVGGYHPDLLHGCPRLAAGPIPPRAGDVSMCSNKLIALLGANPFRAWPLAGNLLPTNRRWHHERGTEEPAGERAIAEHLYRYSMAASAAG